MDQESCRPEKCPLASASSVSSSDQSTTNDDILAELCCKADKFDIDQLHQMDSINLDSLSMCDEGENSNSKNDNLDKGNDSIAKNINNELNRQTIDNVNAGQNSSQLAIVTKPLDQIVSVDEFEPVARKVLSKTTYDYFAGGADDEYTINWNKQMIKQRYCLVPRVLCNVSKVDLTKYIYGDKVAMPIGLSPTSLHRMAHSSGEVATVRACDQANALMVLSLFSTTSLEEVARQAPICVKWQNIYILKNRAITQNVINRAIRYGYRAIVVTCDAPTLGNRRADVRNKFTLGEFTLENIQDSRVQSMKDHSADIFDPALNWQHLADLKKSVGDTIRIIAKGIMCPEDAQLALEAGVDGIFVSNHGGRQLDGALATIEALPAIVKAVNKRCPVFVDGGFRTGADVLKALALGADMVFLGRAALWALAGYGESGVSRALAILRDELSRAMMLCGCSRLSDIGAHLITERPFACAKS